MYVRYGEQNIVNQQPETKSTFLIELIRVGQPLYVYAGYFSVLIHCSTNIIQFTDARIYGCSLHRFCVLANAMLVTRNMFESFPVRVTHTRAMRRRGPFSWPSLYY